jgi:trk system potassium uptake protein TrkH
VLSFATLIFIGTLGFLALPGIYTGSSLGLLDALFTATSAVCVTGLIVVDTATYFTPFGQLWVLLLIQLGGLGILTFTTLLALAMGRKASLSVEEASVVGAPRLAFLDRRSLISAVVTGTFAVEAVGAFGLWLDWRGEMGTVRAIFPAVFHAISAFCNAGFSTFSDSLMGYQGSWMTLGVVMALVVLGGLGFVVLEDLRAGLKKRSTHRLSLHTRIVLVTTILLLVSSWVMFSFFEAGDELIGLGPAHRLLNGLFMAVTPRTAGFNTVDYGSVNNPSVFLTMILMVIGGSPGSTAGGLKTVTFGILVLVLIARLRGDARVSAFGRTLPRETIQRAVGLVIGGIILLAAAVFLLLIVELPSGGPENRAEFVMLVFEAASAFGTVGLSMGVTAALTGLGKAVIILLMFVGRIGPLVVVSAMTWAGRGSRPAFRYGEEDIIIG